jgi:hypothetical protein
MCPSGQLYIIVPCILRYTHNESMYNDDNGSLWSEFPDHSKRLQFDKRDPQVSDYMKRIHVPQSPMSKTYTW